MTLRSSSRIAARGAFLAAFLSFSAPLFAQPSREEMLKVYKKECWECHAADGKGRPTKAKMLKIELSLLDLTRKENMTRSREELRKVLLDGKDQMPSYRAKLKPEMVDPLLDYCIEFLEKRTGVASQATREKEAAAAKTSP